MSHVDIAIEIGKLWPNFQRVYRQGFPYMSAPYIDTRRDSPRYLRNRYTFEDLPAIRIKLAAKGHYRLRTDISQCYGTIYTHSVSWALIGKDKTKKALAVRRSGAKKVAIVGEALDKALTRAQHGQTIGVPVGSDLSHAVAELILCSVDRDLVKKSTLVRRGSTFPAIRMIDDLEYFATSRSEAEDVLSHYEQAAGEWGLQLNPFKVTIDELPTFLDASWTAPLSQFVFGNSRRGLPRKLRQFIDLAFGFAGTEEDRKAILGYAIKIVTESLVPIMDDLQFSAWQEILCAAITADPSSLRFAYESFARGQDCGRSISTSNIAETIDLLLVESSPFNRSHEVAWALALATRANVHLDLNTARRVAEMTDNVSNLLLLNMKQRRLIDRSASLDLGEILSRANDANALYSPDWLLAYESASHGWTKGWHVRRASLYKEMLTFGVQFFDHQHISPFVMSPPAPTSLRALLSSNTTDWFTDFRRSITYGQR